MQRRNEATHVLRNDLALINDHAALLQVRDKSKIYSAGSRPMQGGGGIRNNTGFGDSRNINESCLKRNVHPQTLKNDTTVPTSAEAKLFSTDEYLGTSNVSDIHSLEGNNTMQAQDEHKKKGKDLFFYDDWPQLDSFMNFEKDLRDFDSTFEIGSNYIEDPLWSSICSPDVQLVPSSYFDNPKDFSAVASESTTNPMLKSAVSVPDTTSTEPVFLYEINMANPINMQQQSSIELASETPSEEIEHFPYAELFCPFDDMLVPTSSSIMRNDQIASSSACSGPDQLVVAGYAPRSTTKKSHDPSSHATPDMILDGMAANPLEMYFPPLTTYEQPELLMNDDSSAQMHQFPEDFAGDGVVLKNNTAAGSQFSSKGGMTSSEVPENSPSPLILGAVPVKHLGFKMLQEGMNQLDIETKTCIRDALYRLANNVEQRHCVRQLTGGAVGSSGANRFVTPSVWTETQASPMDRSVAQLLLQKPLHRKTGCQANRVIT